MSEIQKAVNKLLEKEPGWKIALKQREGATPIPAARGVGRPSSAAASSAGGGWESPLTEQSRTYGRVVKSSDGLFSFQVIGEMVFLDKVGTEVKFIFQENPSA